MVIELNTTNKIRTIYHIADIHIRKTGERDMEYRQIFDKLFVEIKKDTKNALILVAGDIFDSGVMPTTTILAKDFFVGLTELCDVIVFRGNHDQISRSDPDAIDSLKSTLHKLAISDTHKIYLLDKSETYIYGNVVFGLTDVFDHKVYQIEGYDKKVKIGLWHGTVVGSKNESGNDILTRTKITIDDFNGYDYVMLGDIHKHQYLDKKKTIAYCGSLIQQNYGEDQTVHGMIKWNINKCESEFIEIPNDYQHITLTLSDNIEPKNESNVFSKNTYLRIIYKNCSQDFIRKIQEDVKTKTNVLDVTEQCNDMILMSNKNNTEKVDIEIQNDSDASKRLIDYIDEKYQIDNVVDGNDEEVKKRKTQDISDMTKMIDDTLKEIQYKYDNAKKNIRIKNLTFKNFNVFGKDNVINYEDMNGIVNISGRNHVGKSSACVYALLFAIFGKCSGGSSNSSELKSRKGNRDVHGKEYINNKQQELQTVIIFDVNGCEYTIERHCGFNHGKGMKHYHSSVILYKDNVDISGKTQHDTNILIEEIVGTCDEMINQCIIDQKRPSGFLYLNDIDKKEYVCRLARLDIYDFLQQKLDNKHRTNNISMTERNRRIYQDKTKTIDSGEIIKNEIDENETIIQMNEKELTKMLRDFDVVNNEKIELKLRMKDYDKTTNDTGDVYDNKKLTEQLNENVTIENEITEKICKTDKCIKGLKCSIKEKETIIKQYGDIEEKHETFENDKKKKIVSMRKELNKLRESLNNIQMNDVDIDGLKDKYDGTKKTIEQMKNDIMSFKQDELMDIIDKYENDNELQKQMTMYDKLCNDLKEYQQKGIIILEQMNDIKSKKNADAKKYNKTQKEYTDIENDINDIKKSIVEQKVIIKEEEEIQRIRDMINIEMRKMESIDKSLLTEVGIVDDKVDNKIIMKKITKMIDEYNKFNIQTLINYRDEYNMKETTKNECSLIEERKKELEIHMNMLKNHKVNTKCKVCMSNDIVAYKKNIERLIMETNKRLDKLTGEYEKHNEKCDEFCQNETFKDINKCVKTIDNYNKVMILRDKLNKNSDIENKINDMSEKIIQIQEKVKMVNIHNKKCVDKVEELSDLNRINKEKIIAYQNLCDAENKLEEDIESNEKMIRKVQNKINKMVDIKSGYDTYKTSKELYEQNGTKIEILNEKIKTLKKEMKLCERDINDYEKNKNIIDCNSRVLCDIKVCEKKLNKIEKNNDAEYDEYCQVRDEVTDMKDKVTHKQLIVKDLEVKKIQLQHAIDMIKEHIKKYEKYTNARQKYDEITIKHNTLKSKVDAMTIENNDMKIRNKGLETELNMINTLKIENDKTIHDNRTIEILTNIIRNGYIDNLLTNYIIPELCTQVNEVLSSYVSYKIKMEYFDKKIVVYKLDEYGMLSNSLKMSGYEEDMANIGFRLGLNKINRLRTTNFFIIDEGFKQCDYVNIKNVNGLFEKMRNLYDFIIVITHNDDIKSYTDKDIPIEKKDGYSYINMISDKTGKYFKKILKRF